MILEHGAKRDAVGVRREDFKELCIYNTAYSVFSFGEAFVLVRKCERPNCFVVETFEYGFHGVAIGAQDVTYFVSHSSFGTEREKGCTCGGRIKWLLGKGQRWVDGRCICSAKVVFCVGKGLGSIRVKL